MSRICKPRWLGYVNKYHWWIAPLKLAKLRILIPADKQGKNSFRIFGFFIIECAIWVSVVGIFD